VPADGQAVARGIHAFFDSFSAALRAELDETGVTVTCVNPGTTGIDLANQADVLHARVA
jgi:short-subunit dehydrogenase